MIKAKAAPKKKVQARTARAVKCPEVPVFNPFEIEVEIITDDLKFIPMYKTDQAVCVDLVANVPPDVNGNRRYTLPFRRMQEIDCGFSIALPQGYKAEVAIRSGHGSKGFVVLNAPGQIDSDYRGRIRVNLVNIGQQILTIDHEERFAQMWITPVYKFKWNVKKEFSTTTERGAGGFGSTGKGGV